MADPLSLGEKFVIDMTASLYRTLIEGKSPTPFADVDGQLTADEAKSFLALIDLASCMPCNNDLIDEIKGLKDKCQKFLSELEGKKQVKVPYWFGAVNPDGSKTSTSSGEGARIVIAADFLEGNGDGTTTIDEIVKSRLSAGTYCEDDKSTSVTILGQEYYVIATKCTFDSNSEVISAFDEGLKKYSPAIYANVMKAFASPCTPVPESSPDGEMKPGEPKKDGTDPKAPDKEPKDRPNVRGKNFI